MTFHDPEARAFKQVIPGMKIRTFWGDHHLLSLVELDSNTVLPRHSHPHEQSTFVLEGELEFEVAGVTKRIQAGEIVIIPGGAEHCATVGSQPAKVIDFFTPVREDFIY